MFSIEQCSRAIKLANKGKPFSVQVLDFELESCKLGYGKDKACISTDAICIKCSAKKMDLLKELLTHAAADNLLYASGIYIPPGSANQIGSEAYVNIITTQNKYLAETTAISVWGLSHDAFEVTVPFAEDGHPMTVSDIFLSQEWCKSIEPTNTENKYLFVIKKVNKVEACQWLDDNLEPLFMQHIPQHAILPEVANFEFPWCEFKFCMMMMMNSYATALKSLHQNPQSGDDTQTQLIPDAPQQHHHPPGCPNKWYKATQFVYNVEEFPATPTKQAMTPRSVLNTPASPLLLAANSQPTSAIAALIDIAKLKANILAKLNTSITTTVNSSITSFIKPLCTNMNKLANLIQHIGDMVAQQVQQMQLLQQQLQALQAYAPAGASVPPNTLEAQTPYQPLNSTPPTQPGGANL